MLNFYRVSLTYRVKSAHKVKLTDKQLLQWMVPILLVMLIYLGTWTLSAPPHAKVIADSNGLEFYQCSYNWWDHSLAIGMNLHDSFISSAKKARKSFISLCTI